MNPNQTLEIDILPGDNVATEQVGRFGIYVPDLGETYGNEAHIYARKDGFEWPHFTIGNGAGGQVYPQMTAASQSWYGKLTLELDAVCAVYLEADSVLQRVISLSRPSSTLGSAGGFTIRMDRHPGDVRGLPSARSTIFLRIIRCDCSVWRINPGAAFTLPTVQKSEFAPVWFRPSTDFQTH